MKPLLTVKDLTVVLDGKTIVSSLSFQLERGDNLAIIGPNGSGKTVLVRALLGIVPHWGQIVWVPGAQLGYVPQKIDADRHLPLSFGDLLQAKERVLHLPPTEVRSVSEIIGLSKEVLETPVGRLSGGQFQKALIAFALLGSPDVLIMDEPTASLDQLTEERVFELMRRLPEKLGLIFIIRSHHPSLEDRHANKVLRLNPQGPCLRPPRLVP